MTCARNGPKPACSVCWVGGHQSLPLPAQGVKFPPHLVSILTRRGERRLGWVPAKHRGRGAVSDWGAGLYWFSPCCRAAQASPPWLVFQVSCSPFSLWSYFKWTSACRLLARRPFPSAEPPPVFMASDCSLARAVYRLESFWVVQGAAGAT